MPNVKFPEIYVHPEHIYLPSSVLCVVPIDKYLSKVQFNYTRGLVQDINLN